ncbi:MAG: FAA hydrolase family protein, partial [Bacteroidota bacterium]
MKLVTYKINHAPERLGFVEEHMIVDAHKLGEIKNSHVPDNMLDFIDLGIEGINHAVHLLNTAT